MNMRNIVSSVIGTMAIVGTIIHNKHTCRINDIRRERAVREVFPGSNKSFRELNLRARLAVDDYIRNQKQNQ
jgi:hypothetical protein